MKNLFKNCLNVTICSLILIVLLQTACVSSKTYNNAISKSDSTSKALQALVQRNYMLNLELITLKGRYLEHLRNDSLISNNTSDIHYLDKSLYSFPNPPPQPTAHYMFSANYFKQCRTYKDVNDELVSLLDRSGYNTRTNYFLFDQGFALATQLEQINYNGTAKGPKERWLNYRVSPMKNSFSMIEYVKTLFNAQPGYYRSFVFVISPSLYIFSQDSYSKELYSKYLSQGAIGLPSQLGLTPLPKNYKVTVLVYEFKKSENSNTAALVVEGINGLEHLKKATILK